MRAQPALLDVPSPHRCGLTCRAPGPSHAHCAAAGCHRTFASVFEFDRHRREGHCLHPAGLGLVERAGLWASLERHDKNERGAASLAGARSGGLPRAPGATESAAGSPGYPQPLTDDLSALEARS